MPVGGGRYERKDGLMWPFYWAEPQLDLLRSASRFVAGYNGGHGAGFIGSYCGYIVGKGMMCKPVPVDEADTGATQIAKLVEKELLEFSEREHWAEMQQEVFNSSLIDGDTGLWMFDLGDHLTVRRVGGEYIRQPMARPSQKEWGFGIHTHPDDVASHLGYYVWDSEYLDGCYVEADDFAYFPFARPGGWDSTIRRGMPIFMGVVKESADCAAKILRNMGQGVAIRQQFAWIEEQMEGTSRDDTSANANFDADVIARNVLGNNQARPIRKAQPGYTPKVSPGYKFNNPPSHPETGAAIDVVDTLIRSVCAMLNCPGWMAGESGRNQGSYEKDLLKVAPMVKTGEMRQEFYGARFLKVCRRAVAIAVRCGRLPADTLKRVRLTMEHPEIASEDKQQQASVNKTYNDMGVKSKAQIQSEIGLDPAKQRAEIEAEKKAEQGGQGQDGAQPGGAAPQSPPANPFESRESVIAEHGDPPFEGAVFDTSSHRWKKGGAKGKPSAEPNHKDKLKAAHATKDEHRAAYEAAIAKAKADYETAKASHGTYKDARREAYDKEKEGYDAAKEGMDSSMESMLGVNNSLEYPEGGESEAAYGVLDGAVVDAYHAETAAEKSAGLAAVEKAATGMKNAADATPEIKQQADEILSHAKAAKQQLRAIVAHRKNLKAIRSGNIQAVESLSESAKLERCVADVKASGSAVDPWAVCRTSLHEEGDPPFPGAVFDKESHRRRKRGPGWAQRQSRP